MVGQKDVGHGKTAYCPIRFNERYRTEVKATLVDRQPEGTESSEVELLKREVAKLKAERDALSRSRRSTTAKSSITKGMLLDATEKIMVDEGYASVSTRRVAKMVGVSPTAVHYHYPTTSDLLVAVLRRKKERHDKGLDAALESDNPLYGLWEFYSDQAHSAIGLELRALVNHRKDIRSELISDIVDSRKKQISGLLACLRQAGSTDEHEDAILTVMFIVGMGRGLVGEEVLDVQYGHAELRAAIERLLKNPQAVVAFLKVLAGR